MSNKCCVPGCKGNLRGGHKVHVFNFPKDENLCKKWVAAIARDDFIPSKHSKVCVLHFEKENIMQIARLKFPKLKPGSIPTIFPSEDKRIIKKKQMNIGTLIFLVKTRRPIWDVENQQYNNRFVNEKMWAEVADEMGLTVFNAKLKWRTLRYTYRAIINNNPKRSENETWKWYNPLSFLREVINSPNVRKSWDYIMDPKNDSIDLDERTPDITGLPDLNYKGQKRKNTDISEEASEEEQYECYLFVVSTLSENSTIPEEISVSTSPVVDTAESTDNFLQNTEYCNIDSTNNPDYLDETKPDITNLPPLDNTWQTFSDEPDGIGVEEESTPSVNCTTPEETLVKTSQVVDTAESTEKFVQNTEYCNIDSTNNPDYLDETKPDINNLPPLDNTGQTYSDEPDGIDVKEESSQLDKCDTYWFLMSIRKAMKSLPLNRQIYLRCKIQHLIRDELEKLTFRR